MKGRCHLVLMCMYSGGAPLHANTTGHAQKQKGAAVKGVPPGMVVNETFNSQDVSIRNKS